MMECQQYMLDLSGNSAIPSHYKITMRDVVKWVFIQTKGYVDIQTTNHFNRGCYIIQTGNETTANFLASFELETRVNGVRHLVPLRRHLPDSDRTRVKFWQTCKGQITKLPNRYFDDILEAAGCTITEPTIKSTHQHTTLYDGFRIAYVVRGEQHMERNHEYIADNGLVFKWRLDYQGQPFYCFRGCDVFHQDGKCPKWEKIKERKANDGQQKCYIAGSSLFRHASDTKTTQVVAIPGAKIGHLAHHINNDTKMFEKAEVLVVAAGANMDRGTVEASKPFVEEQAKELTQILKPMAETKKIFVVDPVVGHLIKEEPAGQHWAMVRSRMKKVSKEAKANWISLEDVPWKPEEDLAEDGVHYTPSGTRKVLDAVGAKVKDVTGIDMMEGMDVEERPYGGVYNGHYKFGCYRCTKVHGRGRCPETPLPASSPNNSIDATTAGSSYHSIGDSSSNNSLNHLCLESDEDIMPETQHLPHFTVTETSSPHNPAPQPPLPNPDFPSVTPKEDEGTISGKLRSNPEFRSRSSSVNKRSRESVDSLIENSLEKKKKNNSDKKQNPHVSRVQKGGSTKK